MRKKNHVMLHSSGNSRPHRLNIQHSKQQTGQSSSPLVVCVLLPYRGPNYLVGRLYVRSVRSICYGVYIVATWKYSSIWCGSEAHHISRLLPLTRVVSVAEGNREICPAQQLIIYGGMVA